MSDENEREVVAISLLCPCFFFFFLSSPFIRARDWHLWPVTEERRGTVAVIGKRDWISNARLNVNVTSDPLFPPKPCKYNVMVITITSIYRCVSDRTYSVCSTDSVYPNELLFANSILYFSVFLFFLFLFFYYYY